MQNAPTVTTSDRSTGQMQLVSFRVNQEEYGVDIQSVREIIRMPHITPVPNSADHVEGVISLRGTVIPVISFRSRFGLPPVVADATTRIMVMESAEKLYGFIVDAVSEVIRLDAGSVQSTPALTPEGADPCLCGIVNHGKRLLMLIAASRIISADESVELLAA